MIEKSWYEVWADEGIEPPYLLVLFPSEGKLKIYDPSAKSIAFVANDYEAARIWLLEDEYTKVEGRMTPG